MAATRIQVATLHDDDSATVMSWEISEGESWFYRQALTDDLGPADESYYTTDGVEAIEGATTPQQVVSL